MTTTKTLIIFLGTITLLLSGCSSTEVVHIDAEQFLECAEVMDGRHSALSATYIGSTYNKAYLEFHTHITFFRRTPATYIYWTEIDLLPKDVAEKIIMGQEPWAPFDHKKYEELTSKKNVINPEGDILGAEPIDLSKP